MAGIRDYYDLVEDKTWKCSVCLQNVRAASTSNLLMHFSNHHPVEYAEYRKVAKDGKVAQAHNMEQQVSPEKIITKRREIGVLNIIELNNWGKIHEV